MADKHEDETTEELANDEDIANENEVALSDFSDDDLAQLHAGMIEAYNTAKASVELSDDEGYANLVERVEAIQMVNAEMEARVVAAEMDTMIEESAEFASDFIERMKAARSKKGGATDAEDKKDKGVDEATEAAQDAEVVEAAVETPVETPVEAPVETPEVTETAPVVEELVAEETPVEETEIVPEDVTSSEELSVDNTDTTTTATKEATVTASTQLSPQGLPSDRPAVVETQESNVIVASADVPGFAAGQELNGMHDVALAFMAKRPRITGTDPGNDGYRYHVASILGNFPADDSRYLGGDLDSNMIKIAAAIKAEAENQAITASGGYCAPLTPIYSLMTFGETIEPVRNSLPNFKADRGGVTWMPPPRLSDVVNAVRRTTAAQDAAGYTNQSPAGTTAPKPCLHVTCLPLSTSVTEAISRCLTFGNLGARTFPEQVEAWIKLSLVQFARYSETEILDALAASSTSINGVSALPGYTSQFLEHVTRAVVAFRYRHRMPAGQTFRAIIPSWVKEQVRSDLSFQGPGDGLERYNVSDAQIDGWFASRGINTTWHVDTFTAAGVPFGTQAAGVLNAWPTHVDWFLFPEGSFLYLDGGSLDLGLVRDSTLNSQNDYQIWAERFQGVAFVGVESLRVSSHLCVNGAYAAGVAPAACTGS